jgi:hypothetical protein
MQNIRYDIIFLNQLLNGFYFHKEKRAVPYYTQARVAEKPGFYLTTHKPMGFWVKPWIFGVFGYPWIFGFLG